MNSRGTGAILVIVESTLSEVVLQCAPDCTPPNSKQEHNNIFFLDYSKDSQFVSSSNREILQ